MKLASLKHGRDGRLVVVSKDLTRATDAFIVVPTLQAALDDWARVAPGLALLAEQLEVGSVPSFRFHEHECASPLPRAHHWAAGPGRAGPRAPGRAARGRQRALVPLPRARMRLPPAPRLSVGRRLGLREPRG